MDEENKKATTSLPKRILIFFSQYFKEVYLAALKANSQMKVQFYLFLPFLVASLLTGAFAFGYFELFRSAEELSVEIYARYRWSIFFITPLSFLLSWWLVITFAPYAKGSGIPQVMASIELAGTKRASWVNAFVNLKIILVKVLSSIVKVFGGGVLGREGPTIQIASSIFFLIYKLLPSWWPQVPKQNILISGAASGLAAAFNTPLGGIIFAIEELSKHYIKHYQTALFLAVIIAGLTTQGLGGPYLYLGYPMTNSITVHLLVSVFITAILAGYIGGKIGYIILKILHLIAKVKKKLTMVKIILISGLLVALTIYFLGDQMMGSGKHLMENLLFSNDKSIEWYTPFVRLFNLVATFSIGGAGGIFAPMLSSGATIGALVSQYFDISGGSANLLILVGMTACLTGITRAPFTAAIIVFEMTDRHSAIFSLMLAALIANIVASLISEHSFYEHLKDNYINDISEQKRESK